MDMSVEVYAPYGASPRDLTIEFLSNPAPAASHQNGKPVQSAINPAWVALVEILHRIEKQPYHWPVGRTIFQKIAYVATRQGLPTGFVYQKGSFGPFSKELKNAETKLVNNNLLQEERFGKMFMVKVGPNFERVKMNYEPSLAQWGSIIDKTTDLFVRMNTEQSEIVSTVIYSTDLLRKATKTPPEETAVLESVMQWKQKRRPPINQSTVASTIRNLAILRWLDLKPAVNLPLPEEEGALA
jgi:uncharacterized protein YwgA